MTQTWQQSLAHAITDVNELLNLAEIDVAARQQFMMDTQFPLLVTREFAARIHKGDVKDPLLLQVIPQRQEQQSVAGFSHHPLLEHKIIPVPGLLHRYPGRVLLTLTAACPVHCRFCFRRYFPYSDNNPLKTNQAAILDYIKNDNSIEEVIYSGGDPLLVHDRQLALLSQQLAQIKHVQRLRVHTRVPIFLPSRINESLLEWLSALPFRVTFVIHCNHSQELDGEVLAALQRLLPHVQLLNQSVLLAGINDDVAVLADLSRKLFQGGVLPYYLHLLDPVTGAAHYDVPKEQAQHLMQQLRACMPGYLVPKLVKTQSDDRNKITLIG